MKKCIYCGFEIPKKEVIDFCYKCGESVWGKKMFKAIVENMEAAREKGDLVHTSPPFIDSPKEMTDSKNF